MLGIEGRKHKALRHAKVSGNHRLTRDEGPSSGKLFVGLLDGVPDYSGFQPTPASTSRSPSSDRYRHTLQ